MIDFTTFDPITDATDANGWTVKDYGIFKIAEKVTASITATKVNGENIGTVTTVNLPVGCANNAAIKFASLNIDITGTLSDFATISRVNLDSLSATTITAVLKAAAPSGSHSITARCRVQVIF